jgi:hypothetical protein
MLRPALCITDQNGYVKNNVLKVSDYIHLCSIIGFK